VVPGAARLLSGAGEGRLGFALCFRISAECERRSSDFSFRKLASVMEPRLDFRGRPGTYLNSPMLGNL
jgi:hypothetical protein